MCVGVSFLLRLQWLEFGLCIDRVLSMVTYPLQPSVIDTKAYIATQQGGWTDPLQTRETTVSKESSAEAPQEPMQGVEYTQP